MTFISKKIGELDGWRGIAISAVLVGHFFPIPFINVGRFGVELFFVLSGRLMATILFERKEPLGRFYWRRFTRIYPTLLIFIITCAVLLPNNWDEHPSFESAISAGTLTINYLHAAGYGAAVYDHIWSLCIEEHSYLLLGLLALIIGQNNPKVCLTILAVALLFMLNGARLTYIEDLGYYSVYWRSDVRGAGILFACGLQIYRINYLKHSENIDGKFLLAALGFAIILSVYPVPDTIKYSIATALLSFSIVFIDKAPAIMLKILHCQPLRYLGTASFSLYLWQQPFFVMKEKITPGMALVLAIIFGLISFYLIEKPTRKLLNGINEKKYHAAQV